MEAPRAALTKSLSDCDVLGKRILVVGAGGIGCELVKNLVLMGFSNLRVIDLDTIDYSNLNRQFLFRKEHVDRSKAEVAREAVFKFPHDPALKIHAEKANIKEAKFSFDVFKSFDIVLNGLDNVAARRHVNRCCLEADVPLIESGTKGYLGQVRAIIRGRCKCYDCDPPPPKKDYPVCTIRNHPDKPEHCIHWAMKLLLPKLFGGEETDLIDSSEAATDGADGDDESSAPPAPPPLVREPGEATDAFAKRVFSTVFEADVERLLRMDTLWTNRKPPTPIRMADLTLPSPDRGDDQLTWSVEQSAAMFVESVRKVLDERAAEVGSLEFDKDDEDTLDFVTAASNLRSAIFGIPEQSRWTVKEIAGSIIPAIATTNAIIAGFIVLEALKVLKGKPEECRYCYCHRNPTGRKKDKLLEGSALDEPIACHSCTSQFISQTLSFDTTSMTLGTLIDEIVKKRLGFERPTIELTPFGGDIDGCDTLFEDLLETEADEDEIDFYERKRGSVLPLASLPKPVVSGCALTVTDDAREGFGRLLRVRHAMLSPSDAPDGFLLGEEHPATRVEEPTEPEEPFAAPVAAEPSAAGEKRSLDDTGSSALEDDAGKRQRSSAIDVDEVEILD